jgi:hypothetical protein
VTDRVSVVMPAPAFALCAMADKKAGIHVFLFFRSALKNNQKTWMVATSGTMTECGAEIGLRKGAR